MKKIAFIISILTVCSVSAQNYTDALRYSNEELNGTARFKAMGGAFGALGGDFSSIGVNPAGSSLFASSLMGLTAGAVTAKNKTTYRGTNSSNNDSDFNLGQFGVVFPIPINDDSTNWKKVSLGFNYQNTQNFDAGDVSFSGNSNTTLGDYFKFFANGIAQRNFLLEDYDPNTKQVIGRNTLQDIYLAMERSRAPFRYRNALLGHYAGLINPSSGRDEIKPSDSDDEANRVLGDTNYLSNTGTSAKQRFDRITSGGVNRLNFNISTQYGDNLFLGLNLNTYNVNQKEQLSHWETYDGSTSIKNAYFENNHKTTGSGFSLQFGAIVKVTKELRLGVTYSSPTWYTLKDEYTQYLSANERSTFANPKVIVEAPEYKFRTPGSWTLSGAYLFGKSALISVDYIYKNYQNLYFRSSSMKSQNEAVDENLAATSALRVGGEYRIPFKTNEITNYVSLRAGYRYEQSPYKKSIYNIDPLTGYSFGAGVTLGGIRLDASYDVAKQTNLYQMYENVLTTPAQIKSTYGNFLFTFTAQLF